MKIKSFSRNLLVRFVLAFALSGAALPIVSETFAQGVKGGTISADQPGEIARQYKSLVDVLCRISEIYYYEGRLDDARQLLENNAQILKQPEFSRADAARFQLQRGKILYYKSSVDGSDYTASIAFLRETQKMVEAINDDHLKALAEDLVGRALYAQAFTQGDFETPLKYFQRAFAIRQKLDDKQAVSESLFHLGLVYENKNDSTREDKQKAFEYYRQSLELAEKYGFKLEAAYAYRHLAGLYRENGELDKALDYFTKSFTLREEIGFRIFLAPAALTIGDVYMVKKDYAKAGEFYQKGLSLAEKIGGNRFIVMALLALGDAEQAKGISPKALDYFQRALKTAENAKNAEGAKAAAARIAKLSKAENN
jgi:tetratricopeptide (TPR) repeat protein